MQIGELPAWILAVTLAVVYLLVGAILTEELGADYASGSGARNVTDNAQQFYQNVSEWWDTIGTFVGIGLILAIVGTAFYVGYSKFAGKQ